jgi:putative phosphoesterase
LIKTFRQFDSANAFVSTLGAFVPLLKERKMDFLIFSDSHGNVSRMQEAINRQPTVPLAVFYLGDGFRDTQMLDLRGAPLYAVKGNCDLFVGDANGECPAEQITKIGAHRALLTHGAAYGVKGGLGHLMRAAVEQGADLVFYGHTHTPRLDTIPEGTMLYGRLLERPLYLFNPGSIGQGGSFGTLTIQGDQVLFGHGICK